ncbi:MAG: class I SAM-dependent methyltransferase [Bacteroidota bacterium]
MKNFRFLIKYIHYYLITRNKDNIHSPFVFDLLTNIIKDTTPFYIYKDIETIRSELLRSRKKIEVMDYGTGSSRLRMVKDIVKISAKSPKYAQLLFRLINHFQPQTLLELGTSLGISALYQASVSKGSKFITVEGCPQTAEIARENFKKLNMDNIELIIDNFDEKLPDILQQVKQLDYVFFDGNHRKKPTISYFEQCLPLVGNNSFFIFDDIHYPEEMEDAWEVIKDHPSVTVTIDLFFMGLVFFRKELAKQHFVVRF